MIGADACYKHLPLDRESSSAMPPSELVNFVLFGDGAGAAVLALDDTDAQLGITALVNRFSGLAATLGSRSSGLDWPIGTSNNRD